MEIAAAKSALRARMVAARASLSDAERRTAGEVCAAAAWGVLTARLTAGARVALYNAKGDELPSTPLEARLITGKMQPVYPRVIGPTLRFYATRAATLVPGSFGLREPAPDSPEIAAAEIDAFVVPGLAFSRAGARLGWGRGYYDRVLATAPGLRIGYGYDIQLLDDAEIPMASTDQRVHVVCTESGVLWSG